MISVYTASHDTRFLMDCYRSLCEQTYDDWEWVVCLNGTLWEVPQDSRIVIIERNRAMGVGAAKMEACEYCEGEILVELDHDDILLPTALETIVNWFQAMGPEVGFVYSDCGQINEDGSPNYEKYDLAHGWTYSDAEENAKHEPPLGLMKCNAMAPFPHNVSYIWYAPNHVRAFRREVYEKVGGYDPTLSVLDDQDLMCRLYQETEFAHIPECLYLQRVHPSNTQRGIETNAIIQTMTVELYDKYVQGNVLAWAKRNRLARLDLGGAHGCPPGYIPIDNHLPADVDGYDGDVFETLAEMSDNSVGVIRAVDFLEHISDKVGLLNECYRVLAHGGMLLTLTPSTDGRGAWQDPTHVAGWNENSFWYFTEEEYAKYVPEITCRFQVSRLVTYFPSEWHREHDISYVNANLVALKNGPRQGGLKYWSDQ